MKKILLMIVCSYFVIMALSCNSKTEKAQAEIIVEMGNRSEESNAIVEAMNRDIYRDIDNLAADPKTSEKASAVKSKMYAVKDICTEYRKLLDINKTSAEINWGTLYIQS